ncbi:MAG TPA: hypothetical protein DCL42_04985 [Deltaproteobacteria bacterium]|nr:MAG: hypothetical protein A2090_04800 [Deltaproteobacteria bacterium GWD2_42_10]OGQ65418.1 MAG: hypothetical protein A3F88_09605 [Deltaproteobacteria bacterium RIFCSPLOWO2_12_FULL_42_16]HAG50674.1 hypothetical protein [Deltaproteobacteria bacterium]
MPLPLYPPHRGGQGEGHDRFIFWPCCYYYGLINTNALNNVSLRGAERLRGEAEANLEHAFLLLAADSANMEIPLRLRRIGTGSIIPSNYEIASLCSQ